MRCQFCKIKSDIIDIGDGQHICHHCLDKFQYNLTNVNHTGDITIIAHFLDNFHSHLYVVRVNNYMRHKFTNIELAVPSNSIRQYIGNVLIGAGFLAPITLICGRLHYRVEVGTNINPVVELADFGCHDTDNKIFTIEHNKIVKYEVLTCDDVSEQVVLSIIGD